MSLMEEIYYLSQIIKNRLCVFLKHGMTLHKLYNDIIFSSFSGYSSWIGAELTSNISFF